MATSKLLLYRNSLMILKERAIGTALTDDEAVRHAFDVIYDETCAWSLEQGLWNFATRTLAIDSSTDVTPEFGFSYAFDKPSDYVRTVKVSADERFFFPLEDYHDEGAYILADCDPLYLRYVSNGVTYGLDLSLWPQTFARAVAYELAFRVAPSLTGMSEGGMERLEMRKDKALRDARSKDAMNQANERPPPGRLSRARSGGARWRERR